MRKKDVPTVVSAIGVVMAIITELIRLIVHYGGSEEDFHRLATPEGRSTLEGVARMIAEAGKCSCVWKTIVVGGLSTDQLLTKLVDVNRNVSQWARDLMDQPRFVTSAEPKMVSFARMTVEELGLSDLSTLSQITEAIERVGGVLCQPEDAIWLAMEDQPRGDIFWVAMDPIIGSDGNPQVFYVGRDDGGGQWLSAYYTSSGLRWGLGTSFVFRSSK